MKKGNKIFLISVIVVVVLLGILKIVDFVRMQSTVAYASPEYFE